MHYVVEALVVGLYSTSIFLALREICKIFGDYSNPSYLFYFSVGFMKHLLGYFTGIHNYYCFYGYACKNQEKQPYPHPHLSNTKNLLLESILEGVWFITCILLLKSYISPVPLLIFLIGSFTHILAEYVGVHHYFCDRCYSK
jgi:hypothetical protein